MAVTFAGAQVFLLGEIVESRVTVDNGVITEIGGPSQGTVIDARGLMLSPAMIDVHGNSFERQLMPRSGVYFPTEAAVIDTDCQLSCNNVATHALLTR